VREGDPVFVPAALRAVKQWRFSPCLLNGDAVELLTNPDRGSVHPNSVGKTVAAGDNGAAAWLGFSACGRKTKDRRVEAATRNIWHGFRH
jgi:hypothetical protein